MAIETEEKKETARNVGRIEEIQGVVIEAVFPDELPEINSAITIDRGDEGILVCEVQQHLGDDRVRAVAMDTTDGLARGAEVVDTGGPITVPVGEVIDDLTLEMNRARQAEITQEIMEVVAGAEALM